MTKNEEIAVGIALTRVACCNAENRHEANLIAKALDEAEARGAAEEREACAQLCERFGAFGQLATKEFAQVIRARSKT